MSLTNTDPTKTDRFPKFDWPRITSPYLGTYADGSLRAVEELEREALDQAELAFSVHGPDIAAFIAEPIQSEGGDHHFRPEFLQAMQALVHRHEALFVLDEVQTGVGMTGTAWAYQQLGLEPDVVAFGKKSQVCGIMAGGLVDTVTDNVFQVSSRLNSTWGGNYADMVRARRTLEIIEAEGLIPRAAEVGSWLLDELRELAARHEMVTNPRGRGLICAFSLPDTATRNAFLQRLAEHGVLILGCGDRSIRFRTALTITTEELCRGLAAMDETLAELAATPAV